MTTPNRWASCYKILLSFMIVTMALLAAVKLNKEFHRLTWDSGKYGAIDLKLRHNEVHQWFAGNLVYRKIWTAIYPPASYAMIWPFVGWLDFTAARWLWAGTTVAMLGWLAYLVVKESTANSMLEFIFVALIPFSINATGEAIGNGQLITHVLPFLLTGWFLLRDSPKGLWNDLFASLLILLALVQPSISAPFFWMALFMPGRLRPAILIASVYVALTLFAASFQEPSLFELIRDWLYSGAHEVAKFAGYGNLHSLLMFLGLKQWILPASFLVLMALGAWVYRHRKADFWILLGVSALTARFWTYHRLYDDLLVLFPIIALYRIAKQGQLSEKRCLIAAILFAITLLLMITPGRFFFFSDAPPYLLLRSLRVVSWLIVLIFLLIIARREKGLSLAFSATL